MAAHTTTITLSNGDTLSVAGNSTAVNSPLNVSLSGVASSSSPVDFMVKSQCCITDIVTTATAGEFEVFNQYQRTGKKVPLDARFAYTMLRTMQIPRICFKPNVKYSFVVTATTS